MTKAWAGKGLMLLVLLAGVAIASQAQSQRSGVAPPQDAHLASGEPMAFEVVSIRQKKAFRQGLPEVGPTPDGWRMVDNGLAFVITNAYVPQAGGAAFYTNEQIAGLPDWTRRESYEIHAKVSEADIPNWQNSAKQPRMLQAMLRAMLMDRCKLAAHRETREVSMLSVVVGKNGPKFKETVPDDPRTGGVLLPGGGMVVPEDGGKSLHIYAAPMSSFASLLSALAKQPVQDKTGLTGKYDMVIPNLTMLASMAPKQENGDASDPGPTLFSIVAD